MKTLHNNKLFLIFAICGIVSGIPKLESGPLNIINGSTVDPAHSIPYQVLLILGSDPIWNVYFCGGILITEQWVLTSGNCTFYTDATISEAYLGSQNISSEEDELQFSFVSNVITHENFDANTLVNNIGLVQLTTAAVFNDAVQAATLTSSDQVKTKLIGKNAIVSGWGPTNASDLEQNSYVLQSVTTKIVDDSICSDLYANLNIETQICAKSDENIHVFGWDFGGPLVVDSTVVGISSAWDGNLTNPDLFVDINQFLDWISEKTNVSFN